MLMFLIVLLIFSCTPRAVSRSIQSLGTVITITIYDRPRNRYFQESFDIVREIHDLMSLEVDGSDLVRVNRSAGREAVTVHPHTFEVLKNAVEIAEHSSGAFTALIEPLVSLWDIAGDPRIPDDSEIAAALLLMNPDDLVLLPPTDSQDPPKVFLKKEGMGLDLGAIAKGYAADLAADYLREQGVGQAILDFGGNIVTIGRKNEERSWLIGIQRPDNPRGTYLGTLPSADTSIVTSGVYERYFIRDGRRYHHLLDQETGFPAVNNLQGVAIVSDRSIIADAYSTAVFVLGLEAGRSLVEATEEIDAIFITTDNRIHLSSGLPDAFTLLDEEYVLESGE